MAFFGLVWGFQTTPCCGGVEGIRMTGRRIVRWMNLSSSHWCDCYESIYKEFVRGAVYTELTIDNIWACLHFSWSFLKTLLIDKNLNPVAMTDFCNTASGWVEELFMVLKRELGWTEVKPHACTDGC
jgi:hypothetical protein